MNRLYEVMEYKALECAHSGRSSPGAYDRPFSSTLTLRFTLRPTVRHRLYPSTTISLQITPHNNNPFLLLGLLPEILSLRVCIILLRPL